MVEEAVDRDPSQPGIETRFTAKRTDRLISSEPYFLREIFSVFRIVAVMNSEQIDPTFVAFGEGAESIGIGALGLPD